MKFTEAIDMVLDGFDVETVVEEFKFATGRPNLTLSYNSMTKSRMVTADLDQRKAQCGDGDDLKKSLATFGREVKKFLDHRGWIAVGKPVFCDNLFVQKYENDPKHADKFSPNKKKPTSGGDDPNFGHRVHDKIRKGQTKRQKNRNFIQRVLGIEV